MSLDIDFNLNYNIVWVYNKNTKMIASTFSKKTFLLNQIIVKLFSTSIKNDRQFLTKNCVFNYSEGPRKYSERSS